MSTIIIIPARYASKRFPGKPLVNLTGSTGIKKTLIQRSWEAAKKVNDIDRVVISTDDERIMKVANEFGAEVILTSTSCKNGTERCAETCLKLKSSYDFVVNLQGDAPLTPSWFVEELINKLKLNPTLGVATPILRCDVESHSMFLNDRKADRVGGTTVVFGKESKALYFSKEVIPYTSKLYKKNELSPVFHHVGVYAYVQASLTRYLELPEGTLETQEGLEQLRFLENNIDICCVEVEGRGQSFWELNNPEDISRIEAKLRENNTE